MSDEHTFKSPKKRILADNTNLHTNSKAPKRSKVSLEFEMVNIYSKIPQPPTDKPELNRDPSNIPTAPLISPSKSLKDIKQIMALKQKLSHCRKLTVPVIETPTFDHKPSNNLRNQIDALTSIYNDLKNEIKQLNRDHAKLEMDIDEANRSLQTSTWKFQAKEDLIMKNVLHKEQMVNLQIKKHETNLTDHFNEIKFDLQEELEQAKAYKDSAIIEEIKTLQEKASEMKQELEEHNMKKLECLAKEQKSFDLVLSETLTPKYEKLKKISAQLEEQKATFDKVESDISIVNQEIMKKKREGEKLVASRDQLELLISNFTTSKSTLMSQINKLDTEILAINTEKNKWDSDYDNTHQLYLLAQGKLNQYNRQRQIIENSIMDYQGKLRVYVMNAPKCHENELEILNRSYTFSKVFPEGYSSVTSEFLCLLKSSLRGMNVSVVFSGRNLIVMDAIIDGCKAIVSSVASGESIDMKFKSFTISDSVIVDSLNSSNEVICNQFTDSLDKIQCQQMIIDTNDLGAFQKILHGSLRTPTNAVKVYVVSLTHGKTKSDLMFVDLSGQNMDTQIMQMKRFIDVNTNSKPKDLYQRIMKYAYSHSKCLFLADMKHSVSTDWGDILEELSHLNCPYKRKH
jgi:hypothetical protein